MLLSDLAGEDASVVAVAVDAAGVARQAVLAQAGRCLVDRPAEVHAGDRRALPERRLRGELVAADRRDAELAEILDWAREPGRRDDIVDLEDELGGALRLSGVHAERLAGPLDALDGGVEHDDAAREDVILVRLHVPRADPDERARVDRELRRRRRREDDLLRPLEEPRRKLESRVLLPDDEDAPAGIGLRRTRLGVMRDVLDTRHLRAPRLGHTHREDRDLAAVFAVARLEDPAIAVAPRSGPAAAVTHGDAGAVGERFEVA